MVWLQLSKKTNYAKLHAFFRIKKRDNVYFLFMQRILFNAC